MVCAFLLFGMRLIECMPKCTPMTNLNKTIRVHLGPEWKLHARMVPVGFTPLGTVTRKQYVQAFGRDEDGNYWAFGTGRPEPLPLAKMQRAIAAIETGMKSGNQGENQ